MKSKTVVIQGVYPGPYPPELKKPGSSDHAAYSIGLGDYTYAVLSAIEETEHGPLRRASITKTHLGTPMPVVTGDIYRLRPLLPSCCIPAFPCDKERFTAGEFAKLGLHLREQPIKP